MATEQAVEHAQVTVRELEGMLLFIGSVHSVLLRHYGGGPLSADEALAEISTALAEYDKPTVPDNRWPHATQAEVDEFWLFRLHNNRLSWHSYKDEATREKWAAKYRGRGDRVSYDGFIRG